MDEDLDEAQKVVTYYSGHTDHKNDFFTAKNKIGSPYSFQNLKA